MITTAVALPGRPIVRDWALGSVAAAVIQRRFGASFINNTGSTTSSQFAVSYDRRTVALGHTARFDQMDFQYSLTMRLQLPTELWTSTLNALDFIAPINTAHGRCASMETSARIGSLVLRNYTPAVPISLMDLRFVLRWADPDAAGADDGIAVDNFSLSAIPEPSVYMLLGVGLLFCGQRYLRRRRA